MVHATRKALTASLALLFVTLAAADSEAGLFRRRCRQAAPRMACVRSPAAARSVSATPHAPAPVVALPAPANGSSGSLLLLVNSYRLHHGLNALSFDAGLAGSAAANNSHQRAKGLGHFTARGRQCAAVGTTSEAAAFRLWADSGPHRAILLGAGSACGYEVSGGCASLEIR